MSIFRAFILTSVSIKFGGKYLVRGALKAQTRYTIKISLAHADGAAWYDFGVNTVNTIYLGNSVACSADYYNNYILPNRPENEQVEEFTAEKYDETTYELDFSAYEWKDLIIGMYVGNTLISETANAKKISKSWMLAQQPNTIDFEIRLNNNDSVKGVLTVQSTDYSSIKNIFPGDSGKNGSSYALYTGDKSAMGFGENDTVYEYNTGTAKDQWGNRIRADKLKATDNWWIFDIAFSAAATDRIVIWIANNHVLQIDPNGAISLIQGGTHYQSNAETHLTENCLKVYDASGRLYRGDLKPNQKYTFEISLAHKGDNVLRSDFGGPANNILYIGNSFTCTDKYYDAFVKDTRVVDDTIKFVADKRPDHSDIVLDFSSFAWKNDVQGLYVGGQLISVEGTPATLSKDWLNGIENCYYDFDIKLTTNQVIKATLLYKARFSIPAATSFYNADSAAKVGATLTEYSGNNEEIGFGVNDKVLTFKSGQDVNTHTENRLLLAKEGFDWLVFDISLQVDRTTDFVIWVGNGHPITIKPNGDTRLWSGGDKDHNTDSCVVVYDSSGNPVYTRDGDASYNLGKKILKGY